MSTLQISESLLHSLKTQATENENEIYGWLLGYPENDTLNILGIAPCEQFIEQTPVSAIPVVEEFQLISSVMPHGIGPIGIYHSHPPSSKIFHSHIDDNMLADKVNLFNNTISLVITGNEINYYKIENGKTSGKLLVKDIIPLVPKHLMVNFNEWFQINVPKNYFAKNSEINKLKMKMLVALTNFLEKIWKDMEYHEEKKKISPNEPIFTYVTNALSNNLIHLKFPAKLDSKLRHDKNDVITIDISNEESNKADIVQLQLKLIAEFPVYINNNTFTLNDLNVVIKTELRENINQKMQYCRININKKEILIPSDFCLELFGFKLNVLYHHHKFLIENNFSDKYFNIIIKFLNLFNTFQSNILKEKEKQQINNFLINVEIYSKNFKWKNIINEKIKIIYKTLDLKLQN